MATHACERCVDLGELCPGAVAARDGTGAVTSFSVRIGEDTVTFNVMPKGELAAHVRKFRAWVQSLDDDEKRKNAASDAVGIARTVLGLIADREFAENHAIWASLFRIADRHDGYVFASDSLLLPNGTVLVGALRRR
jgi:hypothetical protein